MKAFNLTLIVALLSLSMATTAKDKNSWSGESTSFKLWNQWSAKLDFGLTSYFGDLSQYDGQLIQKMTKESHIAQALSLTKTWRNYDISGQLMLGGFKSDYKPGFQFQTRFFEYNLQLGVHLLNIFAPNNSLPFEIKPYAGVGQFIFSTTQFTLIDEDMTHDLFSTGTPEFVYFLGSNIEYEVSNRIKVSANISVRQAQNDKLDNYIKGNNFDYYTFTSIGISYSINDLSILFRKQRLHRAQMGMRYAKSH